jgi:hypothetical protein
VFTARYGLSLELKQFTFRLLNVNMQKGKNGGRK